MYHLEIPEQIEVELFNKHEMELIGFGSTSDDEDYMEDEIKE